MVYILKGLVGIAPATFVSTGIIDATTRLSGAATVAGAVKEAMIERSLWRLQQS